MYTILINKDNSLTTSVRERITQGSNLVDSLRFLVEPVYANIEMKDFVVEMEYVIPNPELVQQKTVQLELVTDENGEPVLYKNRLDYRLPVTNEFTTYAGRIKINLIFTKTEFEEETENVYIRKTTNTYLEITPVDHDMSVEMVYKADSIVINEDNTIQLTANDVPIGDKIATTSIVDTGLHIVEV